MENSPTFQTLLNRMPAHIARFRMVKGTSRIREKPLALVVEDQLFSRKILYEMLRQDYEVDMAGSAQEGLHKFFENAPDLVFLDIELMDESGHSLARVIRTVDQAAFIVMVTANNSVEDVALAKSNHVNGFIVKPYSKQKIGESLELFHATRATAPAQGNPP